MRGGIFGIPSMGFFKPKDEIADLNSKITALQKEVDDKTSKLQELKEKLNTIQGTAAPMSETPITPDMQVTPGETMVVDSQSSQMDNEPRQPGM